jgi:DNA (cytosine-5)-methyltransferase 1
MTHLDLFTGIGGFHLAAGWAGFQTIGFSEIEPYCCALLAEKWPEIRNYGDIRTADFSGFRGRITVLSAGVPCQPASLAGKRRGAGDDRWLWAAVLDVVGTVRPAWCLFENPPGILTLDEFAGILLRLESLGYAIRAFSVQANAVGAKHRRQRVFIVANAENGGFRRRQAQWKSGQPAFASERAEALADTDGGIFKKDRGQVAGVRARETRRGDGFAESGQALANADQFNGDCARPGTSEISQATGIQQRSGQPLRFRLTEPPLCGRADGVQNRSHRLKALGNAVVPQQAYPFFAAIAQLEEGWSSGGFDFLNESEKR